MNKKLNWGKYAMDFLSIFVAVIAAFALTNWNENRRDNEAATKILTEISNGLEKDLEDILINKGGHDTGIEACKYWRRVVLDQEVGLDSVNRYYFSLMRDYFSLQNNSGYETLKSKGLELVEDDSIRFEIISLYEYNYQALKIMEEEYFEMQFHQNYFDDFNAIISPNFEFDSKGNIAGLKTPIKMTAAEKNALLTYLWKIQVNREFILSYYNDVELKIQNLSKRIKS